MPNGAFRAHPTQAAAGGITDPEDMTWNLLAWAGGTDMTAESYGNGDQVTAWPDESGVNTGFVASSPQTDCPTFETSNTTLNSKPAVNMWDHTDRLTEVPSSYPAQGDGDVISYVVVFSHLYNQVNAYAFLWDNDGDGSFLRFGTAEWAASADLGGSGTGAEFSTANAAYALLMQVTYSSTASSDTLYVELDGVDISANFPEDGPADGGSYASADALWLGSYRNNGTLPWDGSIALFGIYEGDITADGDWSSFQDWADTEYGVTF